MSKLSEETKNLRNQVRQQTLGYITAALGLVAGLAWNDAIKGLIQAIFPNSHNSVIAQFVYAVLITVAVVLLSTYLVKIFRRRDGSGEGQ